MIKIVIFSSEFPFLVFLVLSGKGSNTINTLEEGMSLRNTFILIFKTTKAVTS